MTIANWPSINEQLNKMYNKIFEGIDIKNLSTYEKRRMIFEYLCNNVIYDYDLLDKIKLNRENPDYKLPRDPYLEVESVLKNNKGICNAIAQVYKLLLEKAGIYSLCVICDDGTEIKHQLNLVYDDVNDLFSFDDATSIIVNKGNFDDYFDYGIEDANKNNQGNRVVYKNVFWLCLPTKFVYTIVGRKEKEYIQHDVENLNLGELPDNIISTKKNKKI